MWRLISTLAVVTLVAGGVSAGILVFFPSVLPMVGGMGAVSNVPATINHQGVVTVSGVRFTGTGQFKFAIRDPDTGNNVWTNSEDTDPDDGVPDSAVSLSVTDGVYSVRLGASPMETLSRAVFEDGNLQLRIWFNDGVNGWAQLSPDHDLTTVPYAMTVADEAVTTTKLPDGAITTAKLAAGVATPPGVVLPFAGSSVPTGWLLCNGQAVSRTTYAALFSAVGTAHGTGDGSTTFNLPDLREKSPVGVGGSKTLGSTGGAETVNIAHTHTTANHTLTTAQIPSHTHNLTGRLNPTSLGNYQMAFATNSGTEWTGAGAAATGGGGAHNHSNTGSGLSSSQSVLNPYVALNYIIKH